MKRITLDKYYVSHLYELSLEHFQHKCVECDIIKERLERFLGKKEVARIKRLIRKRGYCNKLNDEK